MTMVPGRDSVRREAEVSMLKIALPTASPSAGGERAESATSEKDREEEGGELLRWRAFASVIGYLVSLVIYLTLPAAGKARRPCESCNFTLPAPCGILMSTVEFGCRMEMPGQRL